MAVLSDKKKLYALLAIAVIIAAVVVYTVLNHYTVKPLTAQNGDNVSVFYSLSYSNGTLIQSDLNSTPFNFVLGSGAVITGFNNAVIGMKDGQTKTVTVPPSEGYGNVSSSLIITVPRKELGNLSLSIGEKLSSTTGQTGEITSFNSTNVTINFNSPLAGKTLVFYIKLVSINGSS